MYGISYDGWTGCYGCTIDPHPALLAVSEQATPADMFISGDFHHSLKTFRLKLWFWNMHSWKKPRNRYIISILETYDTYDWYLKWDRFQM